MKVLAIDPGNIESGYCVMDSIDYRPLLQGKKENDDVLKLLCDLSESDEIGMLVVEMIASYGMAVGKTVFDTCVWIGRFIEAAKERGIDFDFVYRMEEKMQICGSMKAKDTNIRQALIDRFAETANGKGTKINPDFFYGFAKDSWMAFAVGTVWIDKFYANGAV